jgi:hypothetical protein
MAWGPLRAFKALGSGSSASTDRRIFARLRCSRLGATRAQIRRLGVRDTSQGCPGTTTDRRLEPPPVRRSVLPKPACHAVRACLASHATPLACAGLPAGPADRQQRGGSPGGAEERR